MYIGFIKPGTWNMEDAKRKGAPPYLNVFDFCSVNLNEKAAWFSNGTQIKLCSLKNCQFFFCHFKFQYLLIVDSMLILLVILLWSEAVLSEEANTLSHFILCSSFLERRVDHPKCFCGAVAFYPLRTSTFANKFLKVNIYPVCIYLLAQPPL